MDFEERSTDASAAMLEPDEALLRVIASAERLPSREIPCVEACGLRLAESIYADRDNPPFPRAMMDGFAVRTEDAGRPVDVARIVPAGHHETTAVRPGECFEIMTGAPCPPGTEAVVPKEAVRRDGARAILPARILSGQHIAPQGSECRLGQCVLREGQTVTPLAVAVLAACGRQRVRVTPRPTAGIVATGSELVDASDRPGEGQIRNSNGPMLAAMARAARIEATQALHANDQPDSILDALDQLVDVDMILMTGGVSVGRYDFVTTAIRSVQAELIFHKVRQKPGKPLLLARRGRQLLFGLPGNPLACHFCFSRYAAAAAETMAGEAVPPSSLIGELTRPVESKPGRTFFMTARADWERQGRVWRIRPAPGVSSADIFASAEANCYVEIPPGRETLDVGESVEFFWI